MPFPDPYSVQSNFARDEQLGLDLSGAKLDSELFKISNALAQLRAFIKRTHTSDGRLKLDQAVRLLDTITQQDFDGDGVTDTFTLSPGIDTAVDLLRVYVDGVLTTPTVITATTFTVSPAPASGTANINALVYTNVSGVTDRLQSIVQDEGASMVGYFDESGQLASVDVAAALTELASAVASLSAALGDPGNLVKRDGTTTLTGQWELNERSEVTVAPTAAVGSFRLNGVPVDGESFTLNDGVFTYVFEFDDDASVGVDAIPVTIGADHAETAVNIAAAINASPLAIEAEVVEDLISPYSTISLEHEIPYALGNEAIVASSTQISDEIGMSGGVNGSFSETYKTHYRPRNIPRSLRDGDVVVHEQLGDIVAQIEAALAAFLRLDGSNQMVARLNMGGNRIIAVSAAVLGTDAVILDQVNTLIGVAVDLCVALTGTRLDADRGTITGPISFARTALETADADQTTTPETVLIPTIHSVPKPGAADHVANRAYVDDRIASITLGEGRPLPDFNVEGDGLGGGGLANINNGGEFYFEDLVIAAAQTLTVPVTLFVEGNFDLQVTGSITSVAPVDIVCTGDVTIAGAVTCPGLTIRAGGAVTISAAVTAAVNGTYTKKYTQEVKKKYGYPVDGTSGIYADDWRPFLLDAVGAVTISAAITADDVFMKVGGALVISSTITAQWYYTGLAFSFHASGYLAPAWRDAYKTYQATGGTTTTAEGEGGSGGTGGGAGGHGNGNGTPGAASIWAAANRPYLFYTYALARGGMAAYSTTASPSSTAGENGRGGGRISIYSDGDMTLTGALFTAPGGALSALPGSENGGGGGGGTVRIVSKGNIEDGTGYAVGGVGDGSADGGGGGVWFLAASYSGTQSASVAPGGSGGAGISDVTLTLTADQIEALKQLFLFEALPDAA